MACGPTNLTTAMYLLEPENWANLAQQMRDLPATRGDRRRERVRAPVVVTEDRALWVNGRPMQGTAILDSGAMPLLVGRPGLAQLQLGEDDILPNAVRLGLADGKSTRLYGVTRKPIKLTFNPGGPTETSLSVRAVVTQAPYDFLVGNVVLWVIGGIIDGWREQFRYQVNWRAGPAQADGVEGFIPIRYERDRTGGNSPSVWYSELQLRQAGGEGDSEEEESDDNIPPLSVWTEGTGWRLASTEPNDENPAQEIPALSGSNGMEAWSEGTVPPDFTPLMVNHHRILAYRDDVYRITYPDGPVERPGPTVAESIARYRAVQGDRTNPRPESPNSTGRTAAEVAQEVDRVYAEMPDLIEDEQWEEDPHRTDPSGLDYTAPDFPAANLAGANIRALSRTTDDGPEWDYTAEPAGAWYLDEVPGWSQADPARLHQLIDFISLGGPETYPEVWRTEQRRLHLRRDYLRRTIPLCVHPMVPGNARLSLMRSELAQVLCLLSTQAEFQRQFDNRDRRLRECPRCGQLGHGSGDHRDRQRATTGDTDGGLSEAGWSRAYELELAAGVDLAARRTHTLTTLMAQHTVARFRSQWIRENIQNRHRTLRTRLSAAPRPTTTEERLFREDLNSAWREQMERLQRLLEATPGPFDPAPGHPRQPLWDRFDPAEYNPLPGSMEGYPAPPLRPEYDARGRPDLPPGWAYRGDSDDFFYLELWEFIGIHPRTPAEEHLIDRNWDRVADFRDQPYPQMADILRIQEQRRQEPPRVATDEDETLPAPEADPEDIESWSPPADHINWGELPQAFMTDLEATPANHEVGRLTAVYREAGLWAGDDGEIQALRDGKWITVLLLFGGIGTELEALLKVGVCVKRVLYVDNDAITRSAFFDRLRALTHAYPEQLPAVAYHRTATALPWDICEVGEPELQRHLGPPRTGNHDDFDPIHLVTVSSPCQGFSRANRQARGLEDSRSGLITEAWRIISILQRIHRHQACEPGYIFEMVDAGDHASPAARWGFHQMELIAGGAAGSGVRIDAAKLGSAAHRTRVFWTNMAPAAYIQERYNNVNRDAIRNKLDASGALDRFRQVQLARVDDPAVPGYYRINIQGEPIKAFPTLVSTPGSYAFRFQAPDQAGPGMVYDRNLREWQEPNAAERERIMGMEPGSTEGDNRTDLVRRQLIGSAVDVRAYAWLCKEIRTWRILYRNE